MTTTTQLIGRKLGAYEVRALIASGGMGSVYRGYDPALDREVAIKVMKTVGMLPDAVKRFRREAQLAAGLRHPHIVQVYSFSESNGTLFMVQELLPGPTLAERIPRTGRRRLSALEVKQIIGQLAAALDYAHERGVIHRDVKPTNALYNASGDLVLTDFGLARPADDVQTTATGPGVVMGTPAYVAPEQAVSSASVTHACDVYALGVVLFELLTGRLPFEADTSMGMVLKHLYDPPPAPSTLRSDLPSTVDKVVLRAMHKEPERRFSSAGALAEALAAAWPNARERGATGKTAAPAPVKVAPVASKPASTPPIKPAPTPAPSRPVAKPTPTPPSSKPAPKAVAAPAPSKPAPKPTTSKPRSKAAVEPAAETPPRRSGQLLVGLITLCTLGVLLLYGFGITSLDLREGWTALQGLIGR
jgi:serine/threonine-protein kinase